MMFTFGAILMIGEKVTQHFAETEVCETSESHF